MCVCQTNLRPSGLGSCGGLTDSVIRVTATTPANSPPVLKFCELFLLIALEFHYDMGMVFVA